ncbi:alpha/beta hydrolase [Gellertiella hungarica]|nr:alpha/beta hydrolase [Gellertiella hungarica]
MVAQGAAAEGSKGPLKPFKDELFSAQTRIETRDGGDYEVVDYQEMRDINGRDEEPERRVKRAWVDLSPRSAQADETLNLASGPLAVTRVGKGEGAAFTVIFIHGRDGDRRLGSNDWRFGGNFNRLKNLVVKNGGVYYAPTIRRFDANGVRQVADLIAAARSASGGKPVILSCASMGSFLCWGITREAATVRDLKGMLVMGGAPDPDFPKSAFHEAGLPLWFTHGSADKVYKADDQAAIYAQLHAKGYPVRFTLFNTGSHGTPVRMTDWRRVLNWLLTR